MYVHDLDPFAWQWTSDLGIRWYGLAYLAGFVAGYYTIYAMARRHLIQLPAEKVGDFITVVAIGVLAGGRLGYCLFYAPELLVEWNSDFPFWGVLAVNKGGMASHGGILGVMIACYLYSRRTGIRPLHLWDLTVFGGSVGFFFGRIANFINGELFGRVAPETYKWGVKFPNEIYLWAQDDSSRLLTLAPAVEALGKVKTKMGETLELSSEVWRGWVQNFNFDTGSRNSVYQVIDGLIASIQSGNSQVVAAIEPALNARYPSQLYQALLEGLLVFIILAIVWMKPRRVGFISAVFGFSYAIARVIGEQYRLPDAHIGYQLFDLTRGQWLSIGMMGAALAVLIYSYKKKPVEFYGGWALAPSGIKDVNGVETKEKNPSNSQAKKNNKSKKKKN